jgi:hypothetical protein
MWLSVCPVRADMQEKFVGPLGILARNVARLETGFEE